MKAVMWLVGAAWMTALIGGANYLMWDALIALYGRLPWFVYYVLMYPVTLAVSAYAVAFLCAMWKLWYEECVQ